MGFLERNYLRKEHLDGFDNYKVSFIGSDNHGFVF